MCQSHLGIQKSKIKQKYSKVINFLLASSSTCAI